MVGSMAALESVKRPGWAVLRGVVALLVLPLAIAKLALVTWYPRPTNFYVAWLSVLVFLGCRQSIRANGGRPGLWQTAVLPLVGSGALNMGAIFSAHQFIHDPNGQRLLTFTLVSSTFFIFTIAWILAFPFESGFTQWTPRSVIAWRTTCGVVALALTSLVVFHAKRLLRVAQGTHTPLELLLFQAYALRAAILVYFFLVFRAYLPKALSEVANAVSKPKPGSA